MTVFAFSMLRDESNGLLAQGKLVSVLSGKILDVAVDLRPDSKTFGKWVSAENK